MAFDSLADIPDAPPSRARRIKAEDIVAVVNAVAKGMPCESAVNILTSLGMDEGAARKMCDPAKAAYDTGSKPLPAVNHVHVPKEAIHVTVAAAPPATVNVEAPVVNMPQHEPRTFVHTVTRDNQGRLKEIISQEAVA